MNLGKLTKAELLWMARHKCRHNHSYLEHPKCMPQIKPPEKIGFFDIECSNLKASFGIVLSYSIKELGRKPYGEAITPAELKSPDQDKNLVRRCVDHLQKFDRIVGFYSSRFDIPFLRSRAMVNGIQFPSHGEIKHTDLYFWVRYKLQLHSNRLQAACDFLGIPSKEHKLDGLRWVKALTGDKSALNFILAHNLEDVISTEQLYKRLLPFAKLTNTYM